MHKKHHKPTLKSYLDLHELLNKYQGNHQENRAFALKYKAINSQPLALLEKWKEKNLFRLTETLHSNKYLHHLSVFSTTVGFIFLVVGFFTGVGLLSYSGSEPVNVIYFLLVVVGLPLLSMVLSLLSMVGRGVFSQFFSHFFPLYWIEKIVNFFPTKNGVNFAALPFSSGLGKWIFLKRLQRFSLLFSFGVFMALLLMVVAKDIAFGWSTTLQVSPKSFETLLSTIGIWWQGWLPSAIPSLELVELSQYFRLGETLDKEMIENAGKLGAWWQFLAMSTLVYAIGLRLLLWLGSKIAYQKELEKSFLEIEGVNKLLREFTTPYVSTKAPEIEKHLEIESGETIQLTPEISEVYHNIIAWNFSDDEFALVQDSKPVKASFIHTVGGSHTFNEDQEVAATARARVLLYVKSWEPPTMDFIDFLEELLGNPEVQEVEVCLLGIAKNNYQYSDQELAIWKRKIEGLKSKKVWVIDAK